MEYLYLLKIEHGGLGVKRDALFKDTLWVLSRDEPLVHVSIDITLITKDILDHVISLESWDLWLSIASSCLIVSYQI